MSFVFEVTKNKVTKPQEGTIISFSQTSSARSVTVELRCALGFKCLWLPSEASATPTEPTCALDSGSGCWDSCCCCLWAVRRAGRVWFQRLQSRASLSSFISGVCSNYRVDYPQANICAVKNSTVFIPCSFFYPSALKVVTVMWGHERNNLYNGPFLFDSNNVSSNSRFQYHGDRERNCSLIIHHVRHNDSGKYAFRFLTDEPKGKFTGVDGSTLRVAGKFLLFYSRSLV